jgi:hypothetical protein
MVKALASNVSQSTIIQELTICGLNMSLNSAQLLNEGLLNASSLKKLRINFCLYKKELF